MVTIKLKEDESVVVEIQYQSQLGSKWRKTYQIDGDSWQAVRFKKIKNKYK